MMKSEIKLKVYHIRGESEIEAPADLTVSELVTDLCHQLQLPDIGSDGARLIYSLTSKTLGRQIPEHQTLEIARISDHDQLILSCSNPSTKKYSSVQSSIGIPLDTLADVDAKKILDNEPALIMTLHSYKATLAQLADSHQQIRAAEQEVGELRDRLRERNIAALLFLLGQIQIGFGTNLVTQKSEGGWFVFLCGVAVNLGALWFSFFHGSLHSRGQGDKIIQKGIAAVSGIDQSI
jgi:hypothetical protein